MTRKIAALTLAANVFAVAVYGGSVVPANAQDSFDQQTGQFYPRLGGEGSFNTRTGEFYPGLGSGASINPGTGQYYPGVGVGGGTGYNPDTGSTDY